MPDFSSIDQLLADALEAALSDHPDHAAVPPLAQELCLQQGTGIQRLLESGASVAGILMACADYYETECGAVHEPRVLRAFAQRWSHVEAAGH